MKLLLTMTDPIPPPKIVTLPAESPCIYMHISGTFHRYFMQTFMTMAIKLKLVGDAQNNSVVIYNFGVLSSSTLVQRQQLFVTGPYHVFSPPLPRSTWRRRQIQPPKRCGFAYPENYRSGFFFFLCLDSSVGTRSPLWGSSITLKTLHTRYDCSGLVIGPSQRLDFLYNPTFSFKI